jgi:hypothetical protein
MSNDRCRTINKKKWDNYFLSIWRSMRLWYSSKSAHYDDHSEKTLSINQFQRFFEYEMILINIVTTQKWWLKSLHIRSYFTSSCESLRIECDLIQTKMKNFEIHRWIVQILLKSEYFFQALNTVVWSIRNTRCEQNRERNSW